MLAVARTACGGGDEQSGSSASLAIGERRVTHRQSLIISVPPSGTASSISDGPCPYHLVNIEIPESNGNVLTPKLDRGTLEPGNPVRSATNRNWTDIDEEGYWICADRRRRPIVNMLLPQLPAHRNPEIFIGTGFVVLTMIG